MKRIVLNPDDLIVNKIEVAQLKCQIAGDIVGAIRKASDSISKSRQLQLLGVAKLLECCASKQNITVLSELVDPETSEEFCAFTTLWQCRHFACPFCASFLARRTRQLAERSINRTNRIASIKGRTEKCGYRWRLITLTAVTIPDASLLETLKVFEAAWTKLRKRVFWLKRVAGGIKSVEFTFDEDSKTYRVHFHLLVLSTFLPDSEEQEKKVEAKLRDRGLKGWALKVGNLKNEWTTCLIDACQEKGISGYESLIPTSGLRVDVRRVQAAKGESLTETHRRNLAEKEALNRTSRYITKSNSWQKLPSGELARLCLWSRLPRMFEAFGLARAEYKKKSDYVAGFGSTGIISGAEAYKSVCPADGDEGTPLPLDSLKHLSVGSLKRRPTKKFRQLFMTMDDIAQSNDSPGLLLARIRNLGYEKWCAALEKTIRRVQEYRLTLLRIKYREGNFRSLVEIESRIFLSLAA